MLKSFMMAEATYVYAGILHTTIAAGDNSHTYHSAV